jgi:hypothetical protein
MALVLLSSAFGAPKSCGEPVFREAVGGFGGGAERPRARENAIWRR